MLRTDVVELNVSLKSSTGCISIRGTVMFCRSQMDENRSYDRLAHSSVLGVAKRYTVRASVVGITTEGPGKPPWLSASRTSRAPRSGASARSFISCGGSRPMIRFAVRVARLRRLRASGVDSGISEAALCTRITGRRLRGAGGALMARRYGGVVSVKSVISSAVVGAGREDGAFGAWAVGACISVVARVESVFKAWSVDANIEPLANMGRAARNAVVFIIGSSASVSCERAGSDELRISWISVRYVRVTLKSLRACVSVTLRGLGAVGGDVELGFPILRKTGV